MKLRSGTTYWSSRHGAARPSPPLRRDVRCDVAVVGAGISGALLADRLTAEGLSVVVVDKRSLGGGSTAASTALLLPELDVHLTQLSRRIGPTRAARTYALSRASVLGLIRLAKELHLGPSIRAKRSLYVGFRRSDVAALEAEHALRRQHGLPCALLGRSQLAARYGLDGHAAILSKTAAEVDPAHLTRALLARAASRGARFFGQTEVRRIGESPQESTVEVGAHAIRARRVVVATGYEGFRVAGPGRVTLSSSYVIASEPTRALASHWLRDTLLWETRRPYLYARTTADGRIVVGGEDEDLVGDQRRDALIPAKARRLRERFLAEVTGLPFRTAFAWAGTFGESPDGMGYAGIPPGWRFCPFLLGYGGNGITFAFAGARIVTELLLGAQPADADLVAFDR